MRHLISALANRLRNWRSPMTPAEKYGQPKPHISGETLKQIQAAGQQLKDNGAVHTKELGNPRAPTPAAKYGGSDNTSPPARGRSLSR